MLIQSPFARYVRPLIAMAYHAGYRSFLPVRWWLADRINGQTPPGLPLPAAKLRFRVGESTNIQLFYRVGEQAANNIQSTLAGVGYSITEVGPILDFGCGCGRTLMWLVKAFPQLHLQGTDVDSEAIDWCRKHIPEASFSVNRPAPPLPFPDEAFGLVYAVSVFTHLSEEYQQAWVPEFRRILKPGGLLALTFYSEHVWKALDLAHEVGDRGFAFRTSAKLKGILPEWYHTAFQTASHIGRTLASCFSIVEVRERAFGNQDVIIARRQ